MRLNLAFGANEQTYPFLNKNLLAEQTPLGMVARQRPGLTQLTNIGTANIRGIFRKAGIFDGDMIVVADTTVYRVTTNGGQTAMTGTVAGDGRVRMDGGLIYATPGAEGASCVRIATGDALYKLTGTTVAEEDFPDATRPGCSDISYGKGHWLASKADSDEVYVQLPGDATWDALTFATAEYGADILKGLWPLGDYFYLFGAATAEVWRLTGDATTPISPISGLAMDVGCRAGDSIASTSERLFWVDDQCSVRMTLGGQAEVVSDDWVQAKIAEGDPAHLRAWACTYKQHPLYIVTISQNAGTLVYDASTKLWHPWDSKDRHSFRAHLGTEYDSEIYAADMVGGTGIVWKLDADARDDNDGDEIECLLTAFQPLTEGRGPVINAVLHCKQGAAPMTGQGSSPLVGLRYSDDGGHSWSNWKYASTGARGYYSTPPRWNRLGQVKGPYGRLWQVRISDPVDRVIYGLDVNV